MPTLQQQARALGDPTRYAVFARLCEAGGPLSVSDLTEEFALNHNTIRQHLNRLVEAGLVIERKAPAVGRGRPPFEYLADPVAEGQWGQNGSYEQLSRLLAEIITSGLTPEEVGQRAATRFRVPTPSGDPIADIGVAMARQGFEPEIHPSADGTDGADVVLHNCPFASTAASARDAVCSLHLGIAEGLAGGTDVRVDELLANDPDAADCRLLIRRVEPEVSVEPQRGKLTLSDGR